MSRAPLKDSEVEWVVNAYGELGVKIGSQFFWLYKGYSLVYSDGLHENGGPMLWRHVGKREFGETCQPINYDDPTKYKKVSTDDGLRWQPVTPDPFNDEDESEGPEPAPSGYVYRADPANPAAVYVKMQTGGEAMFTIANIPPIDLEHVAALQEAGKAAPE